MKRLLICCSVALSLVAVGAGAAQAEVKTRNKSQVKFEGMLGRMMGMFGGKAVKEGVVATSAVKGDRMVTLNDTTGRDRGPRRRESLRARSQEEVLHRRDLRRASPAAEGSAGEGAARRREGRERRGRQGKGKATEPDKKPPEMDVEFDVKETGERKAIAGYDAREVVMTITVHEKGRTIEDRGGLIVTSDMWLGPEIPAMRGARRVPAAVLEGDRAGGAGDVPEQLATVVAMYPLVKQAMDRLNREQVNMKGTPLLTVTTFDAVKSADQMAKDSESSSGGGQRRDQRHARPQDDEKGQGRKAARHDLHHQRRNARDRHIGQPGRPRDSRRLQAEQVEATGRWR